MRLLSPYCLDTYGSASSGFPHLHEQVLGQNKTEDQVYFKKKKRQSSLIDRLQVQLAFFESSLNFWYVAQPNQGSQNISRWGLTTGGGSSIS